MTALREPGLQCPACGAHIHFVSETLQRHRLIVRRRTCINGHNFKTEERVVGVHRRDKVKKRVLDLLAKASKLSPIERRAWGLTVNGIAEAVGVSRDTVYRIQRGEQVRRKARASRRWKTK